MSGGPRCKRLASPRSWSGPKAATARSDKTEMKTTAQGWLTDGRRLEHKIWASSVSFPFPVVVNRCAVHGVLPVRRTCELPAGNQLSGRCTKAGWPALLHSLYTHY